MKGFLMTLILFLFLGINKVLAVLFYLGSRPRHGKIIIKSDSEKEILVKGKIKYENEYFLFYYPDDYLSRSEETTFWLTGKTGVNESLTVISKKFGEAIEEEPAVKMRQVKREEYDEENINIAGTKGLLFVKKDQSERTIFVLKNGVLISFSMTTSSNDEKIIEKFEEMIESWEWR